MCLALSVSWALCVDSRFFISMSDQIGDRETDLEDPFGGEIVMRKLQAVFAPRKPESPY